MKNKDKFLQHLLGDSIVDLSTCQVDILINLSLEKTNESRCYHFRGRKENRLERVASFCAVVIPVLHNVFQNSSLKTKLNLIITSNNLLLSPSVAAASYSAVS